MIRFERRTKRERDNRTMQRRTVFAVVVALLVSTTVAARIEFRAVHNGEHVREAEICFVAVAARGSTPQEDAFFHPEVRCYPSSQIIEVPLGRFHFFARSDRFITPSHLTLSRDIEQSPEAFREVELPVVPKGVLDVSRIPLADGEVLYIASGPTAELGRGAIFPVSKGAREVAVPGSVPLLPVVIEKRVPVRMGALVTVPAGETRRAQIDPIRGVITWVEIDRTIEQQLPEGSLLGPMSTELVTADGRRISPVFPIMHTNNAYGELQFFRDVPPGRSVISLHGDRWAEMSTTVTVPSNGVALTQEALHAIPAGVAFVRYSVDMGPVGPKALQLQSCDGPVDRDQSLAITAYPCSLPNGAKRTDRPPCEGIRRTIPPDQSPEARFARLKPGPYTFEAEHPVLARARTTETVRPADEVTVAVTAPTLPLFGRVTRGGKPVRARLRFAEGSSFPATAVTDEDGRYEIVLGGVLETAPIEIAACDGTVEYIYDPATDVLPNVALDIDIPRTVVEVTVRDQQTRKAVRKAVVYSRTPRNVTPQRSGRRAETNEDGVVTFQAIDPAAPQHVCAIAGAQGYLELACAEPFELAKNETKNIDLFLKKVGVVRGRLETPEPYDPALLVLVRADGSVKQDARPTGGQFWLNAPTAPGDYFVLTASGKPLVIIPEWRVDGDTIVVQVPMGGRVRSITIRGSNPSVERLIAVSIGGRRVPYEWLSLHLMNLRTSPLNTWTAGRVLPLITETGPIVITLSPPAAEFASLPMRAEEVFVRPEFASRLQTQIVPPGSDEVVFLNPPSGGAEPRHVSLNGQIRASLEGVTLLQFGHWLSEVAARLA